MEVDKNVEGRKGGQENRRRGGMSQDLGVGGWIGAKEPWDGRYYIIVNS